MSRNLSEKTPAKNIAAAPPTRKVTLPNGLVIEEKLNPMQAKRKMVSPDGDVYELSLATGYTTKLTAPGFGAGAFRGNPYGGQVMEEKIAKGHWPFDECPVAAGRIPGQPCTEKFSAKACCPHLTEVIKTRRAAHSAEQGKRVKATETEAQQLMRHLQESAKESVAPSKKGGLPRGE